MGKLVLIRHGESQWNKENRFTGWVDVPLSDLGRKEASAAARLLKDIPFDAAFTSELKRAQETLDIILTDLDLKNIPIYKDKALNERHYGDLQGLNKDETAKKYGDKQVFIWRRSYDVRPPGGESLKDTAERTLPYFKSRILPEASKKRNILVCAHGNSLRAILMDIDRIPPEKIPEVNIATCRPILYDMGESGEVLSRTAF